MKILRLCFVVASLLLFVSVASARDLTVGMSGSDVKAWQLFLIKRGYMTPPALGNFSARTLKATIAFQKRVGLQGLGIVGAKTVAKARKLGFKPVAYSPSSEDATAYGSQSDETGPGLPLTEAFSDAYGNRSLSTEPVIMPNRVGFSVMALVSVSGQKLSSPYVMLYVFTGGSPKWTGRDTLMLTFGGRRLVLSGEKTTETLGSSRGVFEKLRVRVPYSDFMGLARSGTFYITIGEATFGVNKRYTTGLRALANRISN